MTATVTPTSPEHGSDPRGSALGSSARAGSWTARPGLTMALRALVAIGPLVLAVMVALVARAAVPVPSGLGARLPWGLAVCIAATATLLASAAALRRLLPLTALLKLSLAFPDQAPSRLRVARHSITLERSRTRLDALESDLDQQHHDPASAAQRCLELVGTLAHHDRITRGHCERVRAYCELIGDEVGLEPDDRQRLQWAGLLHDVGKVGVPAAVLNKRGRLTAKEWALVKQHPTIGAQLTKDLQPWLGEWVRGVGEHHERWDGGGYPAGLHGEDISLAARIIAVADAFDVMTASRTYKDPIPAEAARAELVRNAGTQFDEQVVRAFLAVSLGRLRRVMGPSTVLAQIPVLGPLLLTPTVAATAPLATAALAIGTVAAPLALEARTVPETPSAAVVEAGEPVEGTTPIPSLGDRPTEPTGGDGHGAPARLDAAGPGAPPAIDPSAPPTTNDPGPPPTSPPPTSPPPTTVPGAPPTTAPGAPPGLLDPVVDPVEEGLVDPVTDTLEDLLPIPGLGDTIDDITCALPLLFTCED